MKSARASKLQYLLIEQLTKVGKVQFVLPDGVKVEIGITQEDEGGQQQKVDDYCYVVAQRAGRCAMLDSYNLGLQYEDDQNTIIFENSGYDQFGTPIGTLEVV